MSYKLRIMLVITERFCRNDNQLHIITSPKLFMTSFHFEKRQKQPDLQKIMTTAIIRVQKENLLP